MRAVDLIAKKYLVVNAVVVTIVVLSIYFLRRRPKEPTPLDLRDDDHVASDRARDVASVALSEKPAPKFRDPRLGWGNYQPRSRKALPEPDRALNALFQWNGHTWDGYEVLGLPAGSSVESARAAFDRAAALADKETLPFLRAALNAVQAATR